MHQLVALDDTMSRRPRQSHSPVHDAKLVQVAQRKCHLGDVEAHDLLLHAAEAVEVEAQVAAQHEVEHHEQVLIVLECKAQVADEWRVDLFEESSLLDDLFAASGERVSSRAGTAGRLETRRTLLTARCLDIRALLMYLSAYSALVFLCCTTRTCGGSSRGED